MKVLLIQKMGGETLLNVLYPGLKQAGATVLDYPYEPLYHCEKHEGKLVVFDEKGREIGREGDDGMIHFPEKYFGTARTLKWVATVGRREDAADRDSEIRLDDFDIIVVTPQSDEIANMVRTVMRRANGRAISVDGADDPFMRYTLPMSSLYVKMELVVRNKLKAYAKWGLGVPRYAPYWARKLDWGASIKSMLVPNFRPARVASMCISVNDHEYDRTSLEQDYDISLVAGATNPVRPIFARKLLEFAKRHGLKVRVNVSPGFFGSVPWNEYVRIIRRSKISVSLPGLGYNSMRYWEIPFYGSLLASPHLPIEIRYNFEDMKSAILFWSFEEFAKKALEVLESGAWVEMQRRGRIHFDTYHSSLKRAETLLRLARKTT